jgi:hypothetical protein
MTLKNQQMSLSETIFVFLFSQLLSSKSVIPYWHAKLGQLGAAEYHTGII